MTAPSVIESDDAPATPTIDDAVGRMQQHLLWMREHRFSASVIQIGDITMHGVEDRMPRGMPASDRTREREEVAVDAWVQEASPAMAALLRQNQEE